MIWTLHDIAAATNGTCTAPNAGRHIEVEGIAIDHRKTCGGDLFVAIKGNNHDGHDYVNAAHQAGAIAGLVERPVDSIVPQIKVRDSLTALGSLARAARARSTARIVAITGSVGKTGTRHLLAACLASQGRTHATKGNYNNHIGAPMSLASMPKDSDFGVFELGMDHTGELASLSPMVTPDVAIITRIADSHAGNFANLDEIAAAKGEIFDGLNHGGCAILNADDDYTPMLAERARGCGAERIITCGHHCRADARIDAISRHDRGLDIAANIDGAQIDFSLQMMAPHWALSAVMGLATIQHFGGDLNQGAEALGKARDLAGRGARYRIELADGRTITLIDDSYNASPASMAAALMSLKDDPANGRRVAILGDMLELGSQSDILHQQLITPLCGGGVELLITFGMAMEELAHAAARHPDIANSHANTSTAAAALAMDSLLDGDVVLIKGSNGMKTSHVTATLIEQSISKPTLKGGLHAS
jgi:UDP-N-acetylmuramoyl-tripeptide--D-alanyl-D-alanine ligase